MPYLSCPDCGLTVYSAATYARTDNCPRCDAKLAPARRPRFRSERQEASEPAARTGSSGPRNRAA